MWWMLCTHCNLYNTSRLEFTVADEQREKAPRQQHPRSRQVDRPPGYAGIDKVPHIIDFNASFWLFSSMEIREQPLAPIPKTPTFDKSIQRGDSV